MFKFNIKDWIPNFIWCDKNGHALAKAIEIGLQIMNDAIEDGVKCISDYDSMPEWRLDELAWETNCLYDYNADVEVKRRWIKNAIPLYRLYGTPEAIYQYVGGYFSDIDVEENWQYYGEPYHFRVTVEGKWTPENEAWARKAINTAKNTRSVLDSLRIGHKCFIGIEAEGGVVARFHYPLTSAENWAGRWPTEAYQGILDTSGSAAISADLQAQEFDYPFTGTRPQINTEAVIDASGKAGVEAENKVFPFSYPKTSTDQTTGTYPHISMIGALDETGKVSVEGTASAHPFGYRPTAEEYYAGTVPHENMLGAVSKAEAGVDASVVEKAFSYVPTGTIPDVNMLGSVEKVTAGVEGTGKENKFQYPVTGTRPQASTEAIIDNSGKAGVETENQAFPFSYPKTSTDQTAGIHPQTNTAGVLDQTGKVAAKGAIAAKPFNYNMTAGENYAGTTPQESTLGKLGKNSIQAAADADDIYTIIYKLCGEDGRI